jgi:hypothetical protein
MLPRAATARRRAPGQSVPHRAAWRAVTAAGTVAGTALLAGCASAVQVSAAPFADDPVCAEVMLALPQVLAEAERWDTTSQGTAAWVHDSPQDAIVLLCGVDPLPPTTDQCVDATDAAGRSIDWVTVPGDEAADTPWRFTTYGREPAVEVRVPTSVTSERSTSFLVDLGLAVSHTEQVRECL